MGARRKSPNFFTPIENIVQLTLNRENLKPKTKWPKGIISLSTYSQENESLIFIFPKNINTKNTYSFRILNLTIFFPRIMRSYEFETQ